MIECAIDIGVGRKRELRLTSPVLIASGALGYGQVDHSLLEPSHIGALVTPPLTRHARPGNEPPRLVETTAGYLLRTGRRNPGLRGALRRYGRLWAGLGLPIIAALYGRTAGELTEMAAELADSIQGIELHLPHEDNADQAARLVEALVREAGVPCLVRAPFENPMAIAIAAEAAGADALVVAAPPFGRALHERDRWTYGPLHSPALAPLYAEQVYQAVQAVQIPVIGRGGLATLDDALALLAAGAVAVQVDSILTIRPSAAEELYTGLEGEMLRRQATTWADMLAACQVRG